VLIGSTIIDLEDRLLSSQWQNEYPPLKPLEVRSLWSRTSQASQVCLAPPLLHLLIKGIMLASSSSLLPCAGWVVVLGGSGRCQGGVIGKCY